MRVELFTVSDAILVGGQTRSKLQCLYGILADFKLLLLWYCVRILTAKMSFERKLYGDYFHDV